MTDNEDCFICLEPLSDDGTMRLLCCGNRYCVPCSEEYKGKTCPLCRHAIPRNGDRAMFDLCKRHADAGKPWAQYIIALAYERGESTEPNATEAARYFKLAAEAGEKKAQFNYGRLLFGGELGVEQCVPQAIHYFQLSAAQEYFEAYHALGIAYKSGNGVEKSIEKSVEYLTLAADKGHLESQYALGCIYLASCGICHCEGISAGCVPDATVEAAMKYMTLSARQKHKLALFSLGCLLFSGKGERIKKEPERGRQFLVAAALLGHLESHLVLIDDVFRDDPHQLLMWIKSFFALPQAKDNIRYEQMKDLLVKSMVLASQAPVTKCFSCGKRSKSLLQCGKCGSAYYCNAECQRRHWKEGGHKKLCKPSGLQAC